jgi:DDE superfamily endonuclease
MPGKSERKVFISQLEELSLLDEICPDQGSDSSSSSDSLSSSSSSSSGSSSGSDLGSETDNDEAFFSSPLYFLSIFKPIRYFNRPKIPKSRDFIEKILPILTEERFKSEIRVSRGGFQEILRSIHEHPVFTNKTQIPVYDQLSIALYRFGRYGNGASIRNVAAHFGFSEGTIDLCTNRIIEAIIDLAPTYLQWYTPLEKEQTKRQIKLEKGFPNCVGFLDGTTMILDFKPGIDSESYYNRKSRYGLNTQIISDLSGRIRFLFAGYPASVHDSRCISYSNFARNQHQYFDDTEYILADSAYSLTNAIITPFKQPLASMEPYSTFNYLHSSARVHIEHCIGRLKSRFQSLRGLRIQILDHNDHKRACQWIVACCIIHNMLIDIDGWDNGITNEPNDENPLPDPALPVDRTAVVKRLALMNELLRIQGIFLIILII